MEDHCVHAVAPTFATALVIAVWLMASADAEQPSGAEPFDFEAASRDVPKPREIWPLVRKHCVPLSFQVLGDEILASDTDPAKRLRRVTAHFWSQELGGKKWGHPCVIFTPADSRANLTFFTRYVIVGIFLRHAFADHERQEAVVRTSSLDWTIVRPPHLKDGPRTGSYRHGFPPTDRSIRSWISRADVADFMLNQLTDETYIRQAPGVSY